MSKQNENENKVEELGSTSLFDIGDLVKHRASGQVGIIKGINEKCVNPIHINTLYCISGKGCFYRPSGTYDLSIGLKESIDEIDGYLLEKAEKTKPNFRES